MEFGQSCGLEETDGSEIVVSDRVEGTQVELICFLCREVGSADMSGDAEGILQDDVEDFEDTEDGTQQELELEGLHKVGRDKLECGEVEPNPP